MQNFISVRSLRFVGAAALTILLAVGLLAWNILPAFGASVFSDGFGTGSTDSTFNEVPSWVEGGAGAEKRAAGSGGDSASPDGGRFATIFASTFGTDGYICQTINTVGYSNVEISYYWRGDSDANQGNDDGVVEIKPSAGNDCSDTSGWTNLQNHDLQSDGSWSAQAPFSNAGMDNTSFLLKFRANAEENEYFRVDGISVTGDLPQADLSVSKTNNLGGASAQTGVAFNWVSTVTNSGNASASFTDDQTIFTDNLPSSGATYGAPSVSLGGGATGTVSCSVVSDNLNCVASGTVTIPVSGTVTITLPVTPTAAGSLVNPRGGGICKVDPTLTNGVIAESNEGNNTCANTVTVAQSNPPLSGSCGLDIALVLDSSGSIDNTELGTMKTAFNGFVGTFLPGTPTLFSVTDFDDDGAVLQGFTNNTGLLTTAINAPVSGGATNWEDGLSDAFGTFDPRLDKQNIIIIASDGNPTEPGSDANALAVAVTQANAIKAAGTHIIALGIGGDVNLANLQAISGAGSVYTAANFNELTATLEELAVDLCGGTVSVQKLIDADGNLATTDDRTNGAGWTFFADVDAPDFSTPTSGDTDVSGALNFAIDLGADDEATLDVSEEMEAGYIALASSCTADDVAIGTAGVGEVSDIEITTNDIVSCTFINTQVGKIVVDKVTNPSGDGQSFDFDATGGAYTDFALTDAAAANEQTLPAGDYSVSETVPSGWTQTNVSCVSSLGDTEVAGDLELDAGETITCTFTNTKQGTITVAKQTTPDGDAADFTFTGDVAGMLSDGETAGPVSVAPGTYSSTEAAAAGWDLTGISCDDANSSGDIGTGVATFTVEAGENVTCTFLNTKRPVLTVTKNVTNDNGGTLTVANFPLFIDGNSVTSGTQNIVTIGAHTVSETNQPGYTAGNWGGDCAADGSISLVAGQVASCTITNDDQQAYIIVDKTVVNNNGGTAAANDFLLTVDGNVASDGVAVPVNPGTHTAGETNLPGYAAGAWGGDCATDGSVTVALGETKTCTITNDDIAPKLTVIKNVVNDNGGTADADDFSLIVNSDGANPAGQFPGSETGTVVTLVAGEPYGVAESVVAGYAQSFGENCAGTLAVGEEKTCTVTNNDIQPLLTVTKVVTNHGGTKVVADFPLFVGATPVTSGVQTGFNAGNYTVSETQSEDYAVTFSGDCAVDGSIALAAGDVKTCTITNEEKAAKVIVTKTVINNGGNATAGTFGPYTVGTTEVVLDAETTLDSGTYQVAEVTSEDYIVSFDGNCTSTGLITLTPGETVTCAITNTEKEAKLIVDKIVINDNGGQLDDSAVPLFVDGNGVVDEAENTFASGAHVVSETPQAGYTQTFGGDCDANGNVTLTPGETKTCTVTNNDQQGTLIVKKTVVNDNGGTLGADNFTFEVNGATAVSFESDGQNDILVNAGSYSVFEPSVAGYATTYNNCTDVVISNGGTATCSITNDDIAPKLTVIKNVVNDNGGTADADDFSLIVNSDGANPAGQFPGSETGTVVTLVAGEPYGVAESVVAGYAQSFGENCAGALAVGEEKTCIVTNDDIAPSITLIKEVDNENGGGAGVNDFGLTIGGTPVTSGQELEVAANTPVAINEAGLAGYVFVEITGDAKCPDVLGGTITLDEGEEVTCTIKNDDQQAYIIVDKTVVNDNGGTAAPDDFNLTVNGNAVSDGVAFAVNPGTHTVGETNLNGYLAGTWGLDCSDNGSVTVALGETKTCTITNDDIAPKLTLNKVVVNDNNGSALESAWTLSADGPTDLSGPGAVGDTDVVSGAGFSAGTYNLSEAGGPSGYEASAWSCSASQVDGDTVFMGIGETVTCTITNNDEQGTLIVKKVVVNDNGGAASADDFSFAIDGGTPVSFEGDGQNDVAVDAGTYDITEPAAEGYATTYDNCTDVVVPNGGTATCTITNDDIAPSLTLNKVVINNNGGELEAEDVTLSASGSEGFFSGAGPSVGSDADFSAGTYDLSESDVPGYSASDWVCEGGDQIDGNTIALGLGEKVTCTITNDDQQGTLIVRKVLTQDNGGTETADDFSFKVNGGPDVSFEADGVNEIAVDAGEYSVFENDFFGYAVNYENCLDVVITSGGTAECVIENDDIAPKLKLVKKVVGGPLTANVWNLKATGPTTISGNGGVDSQNALPGTFSAGTYALTETSANPGAIHYTTNGVWSCIGTGNEITLAIGDEVECSITNTYVPPGTIVIEKQVLPEGQEGSFDFTSSYGSPFTLSDGQTNNSGLMVPGTYSVSEEELENWDTSVECSDGSTADAIDLDSGETVTCVFTNTRHQGSIEVVKDWVGTAGSVTIALGTTEGGSEIDSEAANEADATTGANVLNTGTYYVSESGDLEEYTTALSCSDQNGTVEVGEGNAVVLEKDSDVVCTFTNTRKQGGITVTKVVVGNDAYAPEDFDLYVGDTEVTSGVAEDFDLGTYTISENGIPGFVPSFSGSCVPDAENEARIDSIEDFEAKKLALEAAIADNPGAPENVDREAQIVDINEKIEALLASLSATIELSEGEDETCTITNTYTVPTSGTLIVEKVIEGNENAVYEQFEFTVTAGDSIVPPVAFEEDGTNEFTKAPDTYTVEEVAAQGYQTTYENCTNVVLSAGETETCTITNTFIPTGTLIVKKVIVGETEDGPDQFSFTVQAGDSIYPPEFFEEDGENEFLDLSPDTFTVTETAVDGYDTTYENCTNVVLSAGETETCTITNTVDNGGGEQCEEGFHYDEELETCVPDEPQCEEGYHYDEEFNECVPDDTSVACELGVELLENGGFEDTTVTNGALWDIFASGTIGWDAVWTAPIGAPEVANVEVQENGLFSSFAASEGTQWAELDSDWGGPASSQSGEAGAIALSQTIATEIDAEYTVSFDFSARPSTAAGQNAVEVYANDTLLGTVGPTNDSWTGHSFTFVADEEETTISFKYAGTSNDSLGALLDNTSVMCSAEPDLECPLGTHEENGECIPDDEVVNSCPLPDALGDDDAEVVNEAPGVEADLQDILDADTSFTLDASLDQTQYQVWNVTPGSEVTIDSMFVNRYAGKASVFGYYTNSDLASFEPIFKSGSVTGFESVPLASAGPFTLVVPEGASTIGFAIKSFSGDSAAGDFATENDLNADDGDNVLVYNPLSNRYVLAFEDLLDGDNDFNDLVVDVELSCEDTCEGETLIEAYVSDETTEHEGNPSVLLEYIHTNWTATIAGASWIWSEEPMADTVNDVTKTFTKTFDIAGTPEGATLEIAVDNSYEVFVNGGEFPVCADATEYNYQSDGKDNCEIPAEVLVEGENTITFVVKNWAQANGTQQSNPAGLLYKLTVSSEDSCDVPPVECEEGYHDVNGQCVPDDEGEQCEEGEHYDEELEACVPDDSEVQDVCPNIEGDQEELPEGMKFSNSGNCDSESSTNRSGNSRRGGGGGGDDDGEVLGALACGPLLTDYLKLGWANNADQVTKLQTFLNDHMQSGVVVDGYFGQTTFEAVKGFQSKYWEGVLQPWFGRPDSAITSENTPTGFVYQTTRWQINNIFCPGSEAFPESLI